MNQENLEPSTSLPMVTSISLRPQRAFSQQASDAFKSWARCKKEFYFKHLKRLHWPSDAQNFALGRDVHKLLDYQARGLDCTLILSAAAPNVVQSWDKLMQHPVVDLPVLANEWGFHVPVTSVDGEPFWLTGRMDRIARDGNQIVIIDWKTGTGVPKLPETDWQTRLYLFALLEVANTPSANDLGFTQNGPLTAGDISFRYVEIKPDETTPIREFNIPYSNAKHEATRRELQQMLAAMAMEEDYALPDACPNKFCAYRPICGIEDQERLQALEREMAAEPDL